MKTLATSVAPTIKRTGEGWYDRLERSSLYPWIAVGSVQVRISSEIWLVDVLGEVCCKSLHQIDSGSRRWRCNFRISHCKGSFPFGNDPLDVSLCILATTPMAGELWTSTRLCSVEFPIVNAVEFS